MEVNVRESNIILLRKANVGEVDVVAPGNSDKKLHKSQMLGFQV